MWRICDLYYQCSFGILITVVHTSTVLAALCQLPREKKKKGLWGTTYFGRALSSPEEVYTVQTISQLTHCEPTIYTTLLLY